MEKAGRSREGRARGERGASSVEFVGVLPAIAVVVLIAAQFVSAGYAMWSASVAARAGARAVHVGDTPRAVAKRALPGHLREDSVIARERGGVVSARVPVPRMLPILPRFRVEAKSGLGSRRG